MKTCTVMDQLPDELLEQVFEWVPVRTLESVCARVCRRWGVLVARRCALVRAPRDAGRVHGALRALHLHVAPHELRVLLAAAARAPLLTHLTVHAAAPLQRRHVSALATLSHLRHLDVFTRPAILDDALLPVTRSLSSLVVNVTLGPKFLRLLVDDTRLEALHMFGRSLHYSRRDLVALLRVRAARLTELTLRCNELVESQYEAIGACENLISLQLYSCWLLTSSSVVHVTKPRRLKCLHVTGARLVRQKALATFLERLPPGIEELCLSGTWFGDDHVVALVQNAPFICVLELWRCPLTPEGVLVLSAHLPHLHTLDLDLSLSVGQIRTLSKHPSLNYLRCVPGQECSSVTNTVGKLKVVATHARYPRKYFRSGGEGYRSSLFYYWTQGVHLDPLPHHIPPTFDDDDDDDES